MNREGFEPAKILTDEETRAMRDGLENLVAEMGTAQDKRAYSRFTNKVGLSRQGNEAELNDLYRTNWVAGKVVDIIPNDMTREWRSFKGDLDPEIIKDLEDEENRLQLATHFNQAHKWARLYGVGFVVLGVDDGQDVSMPLDIKRIRPGGLRHIKSVDRTRLLPAEQVPVGDPLNPAFGFPAYYRFAETSTLIHHSRVLRFNGVMLPFNEFRRNNYCGDSVLDRLYDDMINLSTVTTGAASMVYETNVDIVKVKGLMGLLMTAEGESLLRKRFTLAGLMKSFNNMLLLDSEEDFNTKTNTFGGLPDLLDRYMLLLAAGSDIPATRLLGESASGFNATGEGDMKNYYDMVSSAQQTVYKPLLDYFDRVMAAGLGIDPDADMEYEFNPLFQMTQKETSDIQFQNAQRDQIYLTNGVITETIVAQELMQDGVYSNVTEDYIEELENAVELANEAAEDLAFQQAAQGGGEEGNPVEGTEETGGTTV